MEQCCQMGLRLTGRARAKCRASWSDFRLQPWPVFTWQMGRTGRRGHLCGQCPQPTLGWCLEGELVLWPVEQAQWGGRWGRGCAAQWLIRRLSGLWWRWQVACVRMHYYKIWTFKNNNRIGELEKLKTFWMNHLVAPGTIEFISKSPVGTS